MYNGTGTMYNVTNKEEHEHYYCLNLYNKTIEDCKDGYAAYCIAKRGRGITFLYLYTAL